MTTTETNLISTSDLVATVAEATGQTKTAVKSIVDSLIDVITNGVVSGSDVRLNGIGTLSAADTEARQARNPKTGEAIDVPASKRVAFKASKTFSSISSIKP